MSIFDSVVKRPRSIRDLFLKMIFFYKNKKQLLDVLQLSLLFLVSVFSKYNAICGILFFLVFAVCIRRYLNFRKNNLKEVFVLFLVVFIGNLYWLYKPLTFEFRKYFYLIPFAMTLIPGYLALYPTIAFAILKKIDINIYYKIILLSMLLTVVEMVYAIAFTGFTWTTFAFNWCGSIIPIQISSFIGIYGLSFLSYISVLYIALFLNTKQMKSLFIGIVTLSIIWGAGYFRLATAPRTEYWNYTIKIVQGNIKQLDKINPQYCSNNIQKYIYLSCNSSSADLLLWPEATLPWIYNSLNQKDTKRIFANILSKYRAFGFGGIRNDNNKIFNSVIVLSSNKQDRFYDKRHLVPFGEYIPFKKTFPAIANDLGSFDVGECSNIVRINNSPNFLFQICYEDIFIPRKNELEQADCIINITNDGWFEGTLEPLQHHYISRAIAIASNIPLVRVNNYGYSGVLDKYGRTVEQLETQGVILAKIPCR